MAYYCPNCGEPVKNKDRFCQSCGFQLMDDPVDVDYTSHTYTGTSGNVQYQSQAETFYDDEPEPVVDPYEEYKRHTYDYSGPKSQKVEPTASYRTYHHETEYFTDPSWPVRSKIAAGILAIILGGLGIHKFYLGKIGQGVLMLMFAWTGIPGLIGLIQGILYLTQSDEEFCIKNQVRVE